MIIFIAIFELSPSLQEFWDEPIEKLTLLCNLKFLKPVILRKASESEMRPQIQIPMLKYIREMRPQIPMLKYILKEEDL